jgi:hypothetical protein
MMNQVLEVDELGAITNISIAMLAAELAQAFPLGITIRLLAPLTSTRCQ